MFRPAEEGYLAPLFVHYGNCELKLETLITTQLKDPWVLKEWTAGIAAVVLECIKEESRTGFSYVGPEDGREVYSTLQHYEEGPGVSTAVGLDIE